MWKIIGALSIILLLGACGETAKTKTTVVTDTKIAYPSLPDIDKPLPPILRSVVFDYPRDTTKPKQVKATPECITDPKPANFEQQCLEYPLVKNSNLFIGMDKKSFENYLSNQEQINGYNRSLSGRLDEVNAERAKWREHNSQVKEPNAIKTTEGR